MVKKLLPIMLVCGSCVVAQTPQAQTPAVRTDLVDPVVVQHADGVIRAGHVAGTEDALLPILYPSSHAVNVITLRNGDLAAVWFSGTWEGSSGVGIVFTRLPKGTKRWIPTTLIDRHEGESYQNPMIFEAPDGTLHVYHTTQMADAGEAGAKVLHTVSKDGGKTWSKEQPVFSKPGAFTRHPIIVMPDGRWLLPLTYVTSKGIGEGAETNYSAVEISADSGATWKECIVTGSEARVQPTVVRSSSGGYIAFFRDRSSQWIYRSDSTDGCNWSKPAATVLPNNNASVQAYRLKDGYIVIVFDNSQVTKVDGKSTGGLRKPLSIALSTDDGKTWSEVRDVETGREGFGAAEGKPKQPGREEYSYPSVTQAADGRVVVAYTFRRQTIKVVSFDEKWIAQGNSAGIYRKP